MTPADPGFADVQEYNRNRNRAKKAKARMFSPRFFRFAFFHIPPQKPEVFDKTMPRAFSFRISFANLAIKKPMMPAEKAGFVFCSYKRTHEHKRMRKNKLWQSAVCRDYPHILCGSRAGVPA